VALGVGQQGDPFGRRFERHAVTGRAGADPEGDREVCHAGAGRSEQDDVLFAGEEVELSEVQDGALGQRVLEGEVELLDRFACREPRGFDPCFAAVAVAAVGLGLEQGGGEPLIGPFLAAGAVGALANVREAAGALSWQTGAPVRSSGDSCDQGVMDGQRPRFDGRSSWSLPSQRRFKA
jgi:hypothetical protein